MVETLLQLITLLSEKREILEKVLPLLEQENRCIVALDLDGLGEVLELKGGLLDRLQETSERSRLVLKQLACELGVPEAESVSPLLAKLEPPQRELLRGLQGALLESGAAFERLLGMNGELLQGALGTVNRSLDFFGRLFNRNATYGGAGKFVTGAPRPRIVSGEV